MAKDIFDEIDMQPKGGGDIFDQVSSASNQTTYGDPGEIRAVKRSLGGDVKNALIGGAFGNLFLRNNPDIELEKRRQLTSSLANTAAFGIPQAIAQGMGSKMAPVQAPMQAGIGSLMGMAAPAGLAGLASKVVTGAGTAANVARGAIQGGVFGAAMPGTLKERQKQGAWGAGLGAGLTFATNIAPKLINLGGRKTAQAIAEKADKGINSLSSSLSQKYDDMFANIKGTTKVDDVLNSVNETVNQYPEGVGVGKLKQIQLRLTELKDAGKEITAKELHNLKQEISKTIPKSVWNGVSDADAMTAARENVYWKITDKLEELGGEKYSGLSNEYKLFKKSERLARKMFYQEGVPTNPSGKKAIFEYTVPRERAVRYLSSQLPNDQKFAQDFEAWRRGSQLKLGAVGGTGIYMAHRFLTDALMKRE